MLTELLGLGNCALAFRCLPGVSVFASRRSWFSLRRNDKIVRYKCGTCVVSFVASDCSSRGLRDAQKAQGSSVRACVRALRRRAPRTHTEVTPSNPRGELSSGPGSRDFCVTTKETAKETTKKNRRYDRRAKNFFLFFAGTFDSFLVMARAQREGVWCG